MNLLDENFPDDQTAILEEWRIPFRKIGRHVASSGVTDADIIPVLHRLRHATLFTLDQDFFRPNFRHAAYCLLWLDVRADDAADYVRRFLRHPRFGTHAKRRGIVARAHPDGVEFWERAQPTRRHIEWPERG